MIIKTPRKGRWQRYVAAPVDEEVEKEVEEEPTVEPWIRTWQATRESEHPLTSNFQVS
jgi:hypothetical protein